MYGCKLFWSICNTFAHRDISIFYNIIISLKGTSNEIKTQHFKKVRFLHYCYKNSKIFFLQQLFSIIKITMPFRRSRSFLKATLPLFRVKFTNRPSSAGPAHQGKHCALIDQSGWMQKRGGLFSLMCGTSRDREKLLKEKILEFL